MMRQTSAVVSLLLTLLSLLLATTRGFSSKALVVLTVNHEDTATPLEMVPHPALRRSCTRQSHRAYFSLLGPMPRSYGNCIFGLLFRESPSIDEGGRLSCSACESLESRVSRRFTSENVGSNISLLNQTRPPGGTGKVIFRSGVENEQARIRSPISHVLFTGSRQRTLKNVLHFLRSTAQQERSLPELLVCLANKRNRCFP